jgi:hypothetical protein
MGFEKMLAVEYDFNGMVMAMSNSTKDYGYEPDDLRKASVQEVNCSNAPGLTESQRRMIELIERHEKVLAFNRRLEEAIAQKNYAVIDECIAESKQKDYMAEHRQYMAELRKNLTENVTLV